MHKQNNNHQNRVGKKIEQINLKGNSLQDLYSRAERQYQRLSAGQQNKWHSIISRGGTKKDKISLMATEIITNPHTSLEQFEQLVRWSFDQNHHFALQACKALVNIYHEYVFAEKGVLHIFADSVQNQIKEGGKHSEVVITDLVGFYLEHRIKMFYGELIRSLEGLLLSTVGFVKKTAINLLTSLTRHGQLRRLVIATLVNKFGDQDMEVVNSIYKALKTEFYQDLQSSSVLLEQSQTFLFRANVPRKSQFYVINFLNNLNMRYLSQKGLSKLFELFYHFFEKLMGEDLGEGSLSSRLFLSSIKGLNKIFNFLKGGNKDTKALIESKIQSVYGIVHKTTNTKAKIQLYLFLFQYHSHIHGSLTDRYYRSLYDFLGRNQILHCSLAELFFDLVLVSIKQDESVTRSLAFIKRILQLCLPAQSNFIVTTLLMIGKLIDEKEALKITVHQKQNCLSEQGENSKYDAFKREPLFAHADSTLLYELTLFASHYHPTVRKFANHLIHGESIPYDGANPMLQLNTTSFIQKLVLKKQKKSESWKLKMKKQLGKMRTSKYETLMDKPLQNFQEDEDFIRKYLEQRSAIHTNFKKQQPKDIQQFADQVIQKEMDRLNPKNQDFDLSISQEPEDGQDGFQGQFEQDQQDQGEGDNEGQDEDFEDGQFGSDEQPMNQEQFGSQQEEGDSFDEDDQDQEQQSQQKQFEEAFNQIGNDDDDYPRKKRAPRPPNKGKGKPIRKQNKNIFKGKAKRR